MAVATRMSRLRASTSASAVGPKRAQRRGRPWLPVGRHRRRGPRARLAETTSACRCSADLGRALRATGPTSSCSPRRRATHRPLAELALAGGCHVIVEKPLAPTLADAAAIASAAAGAGRCAMVSQNYRFRRQSRALRELVRGRRARAPARDPHLLPSRPARRLDLAARLARPHAPPVPARHGDPPRRHVRMITGVEVAAVDARSWGAPDGPFRHDPTVQALLTLEDGTPVSYEGTWAEPLSQTSWNGDWELVGAKGRATWSGGVGDALRGTVRFGRHREPARPVPLPRAARDRPARRPRRAAPGARRGRAAGILGRRQPAQPRRRSSRSPARRSSAVPSRWRSRPGRDARRVSPGAPRPALPARSPSRASRARRALARPAARAVAAAPRAAARGRSRSGARTRGRAAGRRPRDRG